jgi:hypothetical protein
MAVGIPKREGGGKGFDPGQWKGGEQNRQTGYLSGVGFGGVREPTCFHERKCKIVTT